MTDDSITVYADYACPFCYLGRASLTRYREDREEPLSVEWHPFDLGADRRDESGELVRQLDSDSPRMRDAWRNVERLAAEYGVDVPDEPITGTDSLRAQQVSLYVQETHPEHWEAFDEALYDAVWRAERDVSDLDVLESVATSAGLEADVVDRALGDDANRKRLEERFADARRHGITGVPTFVFDGRAARGAVPPAQLRDLVDGSE